VLSVSFGAHAQELCNFSVTGGVTKRYYLIPLQANVQSINYERTLDNLIASKYFSGNEPALTCTLRDGRELCKITITGETYNPNEYFRVFPNKQGTLVRVDYSFVRSISPSKVECSLARYSQPLYHSYNLSQMYQPGVPDSGRYLQIILISQPMVVYQNPQKSEF
jgi:hypothetical protein